MTLSLLDPDHRLVIAHRGASADTPENTLEAFTLAREQRCDAFECDVRLTQDGVPVLMHDPTLLRTTGHSGEVRQLTLTEIQGLDAGSQFVGAKSERSYRGRGVRVPTLREILRAFQTMPLIIEIKAPEAQHAVAEVLLEEDAADRSVLASFKPRALAAFRRPPFHVSGDRWDILQLYLRGSVRLPFAPRCPTFSVPDYWKDLVEMPRPDVLRTARRRGCSVHVFTVDDPARVVTLWRRGVSGIITNRPGTIRAALEREELLA